jgi:uncharacterized protein (DUF1501 family)
MEPLNHILGSGPLSRQRQLRETAVSCAWHRRQFLRATLGAGLASFLTPVSQLLAREAEKNKEPAHSIIVLWLGGGPSQLETFDPHPNTSIAAGSQARTTQVKNVQLASGFEQLADQMDSVALVRSMASKEGDHERGTYTMKTGFRPDPTVVHPSIGAILCHELPEGKAEVPRHVAILPTHWYPRGGFLGDEFDAFKMFDPKDPVPDVTPLVPTQRDDERAQDLEVVERAFAKGRQDRVNRTLHPETMANARRLMTSEQIRAFDVMREPARVRNAYGDTPFGRGCLAARRLIEVGVRCVEVSLEGWDSHVDNHSIHAKQVGILDPAFAALIRDLKDRGTFEKTVVVCMGEFGRTPKMNLTGGRDHWPNAYSVALAGGGIKGGIVVGETDPDGTKDATDPVRVGDLHGTLLTAVGLDPTKVNASKIGRTVRLAEGSAVAKLLS